MLAKFENMMNFLGISLYPIIFILIFYVLLRNDGNDDLFILHYSWPYMVIYTMIRYLLTPRDKRNLSIFSYMIIYIIWMINFMVKYI